jgi:endonuclease/exonuclease/phosphatase (EEP) superfamily protein YafD
LNAEPVIFTDETDNISMWADLDLEGERIRLFNNHLQTTNMNQNRVTFTPDIGQLLAQLKKLKRVVEENDGIRTRQADVIRKLLDESPYPLIVCGDFNAPPASYTYSTIKGDLRDSFRDVGKGYGYSYRYLKKLYRIDYIFYSPGSFRATRYYSPELEYSDHKPVVVTFDFTPDD